MYKNMYLYNGCISIIDICESDGEEIHDHNVACKYFLKDDEIASDADQIAVAVSDCIGTDELLNDEIASDLR